MKKLFVFFAILTLGFVALDAQTVVKTDEVLLYTADTLSKTGDSVFTVSYYAKDFFENIHLQVNADSATGTASGYTKVEISLAGSLDNTNWTALSDSITLAASGADSDHQLWQTLYWDYVRVKVRAIDTVQNTLLDYRILFDVNQ